MSRMNVTIAGVEFKNPIIPASGTFGFGKEFEELFDLSLLGGISLKGLTLERREGNESPRIAETPSGILNSVGLQNPGVDAFLAEDLPSLRKYDTRLIANIAGHSKSDYVEIAKKVSDSAVDMVEMNISCPNVKEGGMAFGVKPESVYEITAAVRAVLKKPLLVKLTPNVADIRENAKAAEDAGADGISLINTLTGMAVDLRTRKPILKNVIGGLSGPAVKPVALKMVYDCYRTVKIPIVGMGGISSAEDVVEFMLCGATAVQVGTANLRDPFACVKILRDLENYLTFHGINDITTLIGKLDV